MERSSVELTISLGELSAGRTFKRGPTGEDVTFLRLFGLDEDAPVDALDASAVYSPGAEFFQEQPPVQGTFVVFPTLRPFAEPPPLPVRSVPRQSALPLPAPRRLRLRLEQGSRLLQLA